MTILALGGEIGSVTPTSGGVYETSSSGKFDSANARCAIRVPTGGWADSYVHAGQAAVGYRWCSYMERDVFLTAANIFYAYGGGTAQVRLTKAGADSFTLSLEYLSGGVWTSVGTFPGQANVVTRYEVYVNKSTGVLRLYVEGSVAISATGLSLSGMSDFTHCRWGGGIGAIGVPTMQYISELGIATTPNAIAAVKTRYVTGDGALTDMTGSSADVDELVYTDADGLTSSTGNEVSTFTHNGPDLEAFNIIAVGLGIRSKAGATGPTGERGVLRIGSTVYPIGTTTTLDSGYGADCPIWETSPATATTFTGAEVEGLQYGVKSIT